MNSASATSAESAADQPALVPFFQEPLTVDGQTLTLAAVTRGDGFLAHLRYPDDSSLSYRAAIGARLTRWERVINSDLDDANVRHHATPDGQFLVIESTEWQPKQSDMAQLCIVLQGGHVAQARVTEDVETVIRGAGQTTEPILAPTG